MHSSGCLFAFNCLISAVNFHFRTFGSFKFKFGVSEKNNVSTFTFQTSGAVMKTRLRRNYRQWSAPAAELLTIFGGY